MNHTLLMKNSKVVDIINLNLVSPIILTKEIAKFMIKGEGKILNISSVAVPLLLEGEAVYAASKSGLEIFSKIFAKELSNVSVEVTSLGLTLYRNRFNKKCSSRQDKKIIEMQPIRKEYTKIDVWKFLEKFLNDKKQLLNGTTNYLGGFEV